VYYELIINTYDKTKELTVMTFLNTTPPEEEVEVEVEETLEDILGAAGDEDLDEDIDLDALLTEILGD
jgi:hypothetical protein